MTSYFSYKLTVTSDTMCGVSENRPSYLTRDNTPERLTFSVVITSQSWPYRRALATRCNGPF